MPIAALDTFALSDNKTRTTHVTTNAMLLVREASINAKQYGLCLLMGNHKHTA